MHAHPNSFATSTRSSCSCSNRFVRAVVVVLFMMCCTLVEFSWMMSAAAPALPPGGDESFRRGDAAFHTPSHTHTHTHTHTISAFHGESQRVSAYAPNATRRHTTQPILDCKVTLCFCCVFTSHHLLDCSMFILMERDVSEGDTLQHTLFAADGGLPSCGMAALLLHLPPLHLPCICIVVVLLVALLS